MVKQLTKSEYENEQWWKDTQAWIAKIPKEFDSKKSIPKKAWKVFEADSWDAAMDAAWDAARDAARDAAWDAARDAAWGTAWVAARAAAMDAAMDAALLARIKICAGLNIDKKHIKHAEDRWEANKRGFRVWCDVDGVLYVYRKKRG